jgi:hypothetical protein
VNFAPPAETPALAAIRLDQERIRKEQFEKSKIILEQPPKCYSESFTFRLRQWQNTQFSGLWELSVMDKTGRQVEQIISDADALSNCLENLAAILENRGF